VAFFEVCLREEAFFFAVFLLFLLVEPFFVAILHLNSACRSVKNRFRQYCLPQIGVGV
jgi:hypothetical protein